jgi:DnaK suppressor protein
MKKSTAATATDSHNDYRRMLFAKREDVLAGLGNKFDTIAKMGRLNEEDQAQVEHEQFVSLRKNKLDYTQLRMVEEAIDRLDSGDYGICVACDEPIAPKRLKALPWARYCVTCQDTVGAQMDREQAESRMGHPVMAGKD